MSDTFKSKTPFGRRFYELRDSTIFVKGDIPMKGNFETEISLTDLDAKYDRLRLRSQFFTIGIFFTGGSILAYVAETMFAHMDVWNTACLFTLMWTVIGVVLLLIGLKRYEIAQFKTKAGVSSVAIFADGPMKKEFARFVALIVSRITAKHDGV